MEFKRLVLDWFFILMLMVGVVMVASGICAHGIESNIVIGSAFLCIIGFFYLLLCTEIIIK